MLLLVEQVPAQVESQNGKNSMVRDLLYKFLVQAMLFKAEVFLSELGLKHETLRHGIGALEEGIVFLIKSEINRPKKDDSEDEKLLLADFKQLAAEVSSVCSCADNLESQLSGLLDKLEPLKLNLRRLYFRRPNSGFPKTPGVGRVESLLERLKEKQDSLACAAYQIEVICTDLELCLKHSDADETARGPLVEAAYQIEHVIDSMGGTKYSESLLLMWLYDQSLEIKNLTVHIRNTPPIPKQRSVPPPIPKQSKIPPHALDDETSPMVGFQEEKADMIHRLTTDSKCLEVVSIIGMPGSDDVLAMSATSDLEAKLYQSLKGKRYLIVMDDVWSGKVFSDLQRLFPDDLLQSRILITSRNAEVAKVSPNNSYHLRLLSEEESLELLRLRIFGDKGWPSIECLEVEKQIIQSCNLLPLVIVAVANLLRSREEHT